MIRNLCISIVLLLFVRCKDDTISFCPGFTNDPFINLHSDQDSFGVIFSDTGAFSDTIFTTDGWLRIPVDANSDTMHYTAMIDTARLMFDVTYQSSIFYCEGSDQLLTRFDSLTFEWDSNAFNLLHEVNNQSNPVDSTLDYSDEVNGFRDGHYFRIQR